ncbi:MAG: MBL fold metallo-hydrolase [Candidatus Promineofilum sp.]|nr:MBL fold metallo-hydrolase [Promineifilum sp.]
MTMPNDVLWIDAGSVNCYLCRDPDGYTLIDTGTPGKADLIFERLLEFGGQPADLRRIIITHADMDHAGSVAAVQARSGATIHAGEATAALLVQGRSPRHMPAVVQFVIDRFIRYSRPAPDQIETCAGGDTLPVLGGLRVLAAPGHTPDQHAFYSPATGVLFAGDALNTRDGRLQLTPARMTADMAAAERTAVRLLELSPAVIACGHGVPLSDNPKAVADLLAALTPLPEGQT